MRRIISSLAIIALGTLAVAVSAQGHASGSRVRVCDRELNVDAKPNRIYRGVLFKGQSIDVQRRSPSGKYSYGFAYGHVNKHGWVLSSGLCDQTGSARARGDGDYTLGRIRICTSHVNVKRTPAGDRKGALEEGESIRVSKYSASHRYAYGFAYGHANTHGWVRTANLCGHSFA